MKVTKAFGRGFSLADNFPGMIIFIYITNLLMGFLLSLPVLSVLREEFGDSMVLRKLIREFDYVAGMDFYTQAQKSLFQVFRQIWWVGVLYLLVQVFISGGMLNAFKENSFRWNKFFGDCVNFFYRFFKLSIYGILVQSVIFLLIFFPFLKAFPWFYRISPNEFVLYGIIFLVLLLYSVLFYFIHLVFSYTKYKITLTNTQRVLIALSQTLLFCGKKFWKIIGLNILLSLIPMFLFAIVLFVNLKLKLDSALGVILLFVLQQVMMFLRIWLRTWKEASQWLMFASESEGLVQEHVIERKNWDTEAKKNEIEADYKEYLEERENKILVLKNEVQTLENLQNEAIKRIEKFAPVYELLNYKNSLGKEVIVETNSTDLNKEIVEKELKEESIPPIEEWELIDENTPPKKDTEKKKIVEIDDLFEIEKENEKE